VEIKEEFDRITSIISPFSGIEFIPQEVLIPAADRGTLVHQYVQAFISDWEIHVVDEGLKGYIDSFKKFWKSYSHIIEGGKHIIEKRFYCDELKITGQIDLIVEFENRTYIFDWKTSAREYKSSYRLQGAAYKHLCKVNGLKHVDDAMFVKLKKDGTSSTQYKYSTYEEDIHTFKKCVELYRFFNMKNTRKKW